MVSALRGVHDALDAAEELAGTPAPYGPTLDDALLPAGADIAAAVSGWAWQPHLKQAL